MKSRAVRDSMSDDMKEQKDDVRIQPDVWQARNQTDNEPAQDEQNGIGDFELPRQQT